MRQYRLADAQRLDSFLVGPGEQVLVMLRGGQAQNVADDVREGELHWVWPLRRRQRCSDRMSLCMGIVMLRCNKNAVMLTC
jgi:hypothetical protein